MKAESMILLIIVRCLLKEHNKWTDGLQGAQVSRFRWGPHYQPPASTKQQAGVTIDESDRAIPS